VWNVSLTIGILGSPADGEVNALSQALTATSCEVAIADTRAFPRDAVLSVDAESISFSGFQLDEVAAVYVRSIEANPADARLSKNLKRRPHATISGLREKGALLTSALRMLIDLGVPVVNTPDVNRLHRLKPYQLALLKSRNVPVPDLLATNDPAAVRDFAARHNGVVYKPIAGGAKAKLLKIKDLASDRIELLRNAPVLFQERVEGRTMRVYVVDGDVVSAAVMSSPALDYRERTTSIERVELPPAMSGVCVRAAAACDMRFCGLDIIETSSGRCVVIDCNPSPMFAEFDRRVGDDVAGHLARLLTRLGQARERGNVSE